MGDARAGRSLFWEDLAKDLEDPTFLREYIVESVRIATIDRMVNELHDALKAAGLSKAALARAINVDQAAVRRLFTAAHVNPTLGTLTEVATALGMRVTLEPLAPEERKQVTEPLLAGEAPDTLALAGHLEEMRERGRKAELV